MYIDGVILFSILIVVLTCAVVVYFGFYVRKHFRQDELKSAKNIAEERRQGYPVIGVGEVNGPGCR